MASLTSIRGRNLLPEDRLYLPIAALGLGAVMLALAVGAVVGLYHGDFWTQAALAPPADKVRRGVIAATGAWNPAVLLFGISVLMTSVLLVLRRIIKTIEARGTAMTAYLPSLLVPQRSK